MDINVCISKTFKVRKRRMKPFKQFINEGKVLGQTLTISSAPDKVNPNSGDTTILKWGKKTIDIFNLPNGAGKLEKLIPKPIVRSKDKDWEPFIILAIGMGLL